MKRGAIAAVVFGIAGVAVLIGLGVWQLKRLTWKEAQIASLEQQFAAAPDMLTSLKPYGPGFRVIAPLTEAGGRVILVDLGYVPEAAKDAAARPAMPVEVVGALYWPDETDSFIPAPDRDANIWFARDLMPMAQALGTEPILVIAERHDAGAWPKPLRLGINLPNDHLQYALTWFSLALVWAVMSAMLVQRERRQLSAE
jgi:surfeit locus 1 family protein